MPILFLLVTHSILCFEEVLLVTETEIDIYSVVVLCQNRSNLWHLLGPYLPLAWFFYCAEVRMMFGSGEGVNQWPSKVVSTSLHYANATNATPNWRFYNLGKHVYSD